MSWHDVGSFRYRLFLIGQLLFLSRLDGRHQLWVYTGPAFDRHKPLGTIGDGVAIPMHFRKIIVDERAEGRISTSGFMLRNGESAPFYECMATGDSIELATGIDFLPSLEDVAEEEAESRFILSDWQGTDTSSAKPAVASPPARTPRVRETVPSRAPSPPPAVSATIYSTRTGKKYHLNGCRYLSASKFRTTVVEARELGLTPCSMWKPPAR